ncbi:MAG: PorV/PorQ family protein [Endomicrobiales bacterium]|nr:PorV/PorQ family protein [Endomicrobiales bacterium]
MNFSSIKNIFTACLIAAMCLCRNAFASGTTGADFLNIAVGARPAGAGEAFVAVADETSGMYYNPAGLAFSNSPEVQAMYSMWLADTYYNYLGYSHPLKFGTLGLGVQYLSSPSMPKISNGVREGDFNFNNNAISLHYSRKMSEWSSFGLNVKNIQNNIDTFQESAVTGDFGLMLRTLGEGFSFGLSGQNIFGKLGEDELPAAYKAGVAFKAGLTEHYSDVLFSLEAGQANGSPAYYSAGLEHWGAGVLGLRFGYKYFADEKLRQSLDPLAPWRAGLSLRIRTIAVDYAYQPFAALGTTHRISLTWRAYGWQKTWRSVPGYIKAEPAIFSPNNDGAKDSVFFVPQAPDIKDVQNWELRLMDIGKKTQKKFDGKDVLPKILSWEGQTDSGAQVPEGKYFYQFIVEGDGRKRAKTEAGEIVADLTPPAASLQLSATTFTPNADGLEDSVTFYVSVSDAYGIDQWQINIMNEKGKNVKVIKSTEIIPQEIVWDGKDEYYGAVVPNGEFSVRLTAWDVAGNKTRTTVNLGVRVPPKQIIKEVVKEIEVKEDKRGLIVNLSSKVMFGPGKAVLRPQASSALEELANLLQTYPDNIVLIEGHTDSSGSLKRNRELSSQRAWSVYSYLVKKGVAPARLKPKGYGPSKPVATNRTAAGRALNRRVEIIILKKDKQE